MDEWLELSDLVERIQELLDLGLFDEAHSLLDSYAMLYGDEWEIYYLYSRIYLEQNQPKDAIPYLHKSLKFDKKNPDVLLGLFYACSQLSQFKKAARYLLRAEKYNPDNEPVLSALIWYYTETNRFDQAIGYFEKAMTLGTDNPETFRNAGLAYERIGQNDNAEHCFKTALQLNPQFDEVRDLLADHYIFRGEIQKSISLYQDYLRESPRNVRTLSRLVFCLSQNNQMEDALALAQETIRLYPNSPVGYVDIAYVYLNSGRIDLALSSASRALDVSPIDAEALRVKAIAYSEKGDNAEAARAFAAALSHDPQNAEIMRDYYHHLRTVEDFTKMEKLVFAVIKLERPYCIEDYWFLADYYREKGENLRAFHFLHKAYETMPGEKELIPPMVDIMLDAGHVRYSVPFLMRYVENNGWNEVMNQFSRHKRLKNKWSREGVRFLRFYGQKPSEFRKYLFLVYFEKFLMLSLALIFPLCAVFFYFFCGTAGLITVAALFLIIAVAWTIIKFIATRGLPGRVPTGPAHGKI
jgi:tetratricopeptide (TPR) repeat protein